MSIDLKRAELMLTVRVVFGREILKLPHLGKNRGEDVGR